MHQLGHTRSSLRPDHLLQTPDTFVRTPLPGLVGGFAIVHAAPQMGAEFAMMTLEMEAKGTLSQGSLQRFVYVLEGELQLHEPASRQSSLRAGSFAYLPVKYAHTLVAQSAVRAIVIEKIFEPLTHTQSAPQGQGVSRLTVGVESQIASSALNGDEGVAVRTLLPASLVLDFAVNTMTYAPGASLSQVEVHYMEHGLLMLEGSGIYRLGDAWYPVQAGDFIWMAPYCPQWFGCIGKGPAKYLIYKNFNRHVVA